MKASRHDHLHIHTRPSSTTTQTQCSTTNIVYVIGIINIIINRSSSSSLNCLANTWTDSSTRSRNSCLCHRLQPTSATQNERNVCGSKCLQQIQPLLHKLCQRPLQRWGYICFTFLNDALPLVAPLLQLLRILFLNVRPLLKTRLAHCFQTAITVHSQEYEHEGT